MATTPRQTNGAEMDNGNRPPGEAEKEKSGVTLGSPSPTVDAQWKAVFHEHVQDRALALQAIKTENLRKRTLQQKKEEEKEPPDRLPQDWLNMESMTLETRAYLLDKLLPTLVPAVEKLLQVAERKQALDPKEPEACPFNPMRFLGEYLMRHNPAYDVTAKPNPYVRGLKAITDQLKTRVPDTVLHKLAQMKNLVEEKRHHREDVEDIKAQVNQLRKQALALQFHEWTLDASGQIPLALVTGANETGQQHLASKVPPHISSPEE